MVTLSAPISQFTFFWRFMPQAPERYADWVTGWKRQFNKSPFSSTNCLRLGKWTGIYRIADTIVKLHSVSFGLLLLQVLSTAVPRSINSFLGCASNEYFEGGYINNFKITVQSRSMDNISKVSSQRYLLQPKIAPKLFFFFLLIGY